MATINVRSRAPFDNFTFDMYNRLLDTISIDYQAHYIWSDPPWELKEFLNNVKCTRSNIVLGIKDLLDMWDEVDYWGSHETKGAINILRLAKKYPKKNFVLFTSLENLESEIPVDTNVQIVPWGGDIINQINLYTELEPVLNKNFDSDKTFISLNRQPRSHRIVLLSYLLGQGLDRYGYLSYLKPEKHMDFLDRISWSFSPEHDEKRQQILNGYDRLLAEDLQVDDPDIYGPKPNDNIGNFNRSLRSKYINSFVEIVSESTFTSSSFLVTEKTLHSVYGCNFPIILNSPGAVLQWRSLGFDLFDDIVDHSYDAISNPFDRIFAAVDRNRRLLMDPGYAKQCWADCRDRFVNNIKVAKTIDFWYKNRTQTIFSNLKWID